MAEGDRDLASQIFGGDEAVARPTASRTNSSSNAVAGPSNAAASTEQNQTQKKKKMKKKDKQDGEGKKKKKKKKKKEREESYDSQDEAPDDGDLNAEEFIVGESSFPSRPVWTFPSHFTPLPIPLRRCDSTCHLQTLCCE